MLRQVHGRSNEFVQVCRGRCGLDRREKDRRSETMRPTRAVSVEIRLKYLRNSASRPGGKLPLAMRRSSSMERLSTPETGLLISWATLAASWPREARRSDWMSLRWRRAAVGCAPLLCSLASAAFR